MKPALAAGVLAALFIGGVALATSRNSASTSPVAAPPQTAVAPAPVAPVPDAYAPPAGSAALAPGGVPALPPEAAPAPVRERVVYRDRVVYTERAPRARVVRSTRSGRKSAAIIGGSAAAGAITGALVKGKKGAIIGGVVGGAAGTVYDRKTRKKKRVVYQ
jgi:hypothetical protein